MCKHCFRRIPEESEDAIEVEEGKLDASGFYDKDSRYFEYYCTFDAEPRPKCDGHYVTIDGNGDYLCFEELLKFNDISGHHAWGKWANKNRVNPWGICRKFEED